MAVAVTLTMALGCIAGHEGTSVKGRDWRVNSGKGEIGLYLAKALPLLKFRFINERALR